MREIASSVRRRVRVLRRVLMSYGRSKVFCVGCNKTGTTSLERALRELGFLMGNQKEAEYLSARCWARRDFRPIVRYCRTAVAFQDVPFSKPYTFQALDLAFPNSKFILTVRKSPDQWYESITRFHAQLWGEGGRVPTKEDLEKADYRYVGYPWEMNRASYSSPEDDPYNKKCLVDSYERHNANVIEYFRHRSDDLLVLDVSEDGSYRKLCEFLGKPCVQDEFPWENKTPVVRNR